MLCYLRYRDDLLVVAKSTEQATVFFDNLYRQAKLCWKIDVGVPDECAVPFLDLLVYTGSRYKHRGLLDFAPYVKPSARHIPLSKCFVTYECQARSLAY